MSMPHVTEQPPSVDFIENHLPTYHTAFSNRLCTYDSQLQSFVPRMETVDHRLAEDGHDTSPIDPALPPRQLMPVVIAMKFWTHLLPESINKLKIEHTEPKLLGNSGFGIRQKESWEEILAQLQASQEQYDGKASDFKGKMKTGYRKVYRAVANHSEVVAKAIDGLLDQDIVSPVKGIVKVLFDATRVAANVRDQVKGTFSGGELGTRFEDIEIFLSVFDGDENIENASVQLLVAVLAAVEGTMEFFLSRQAQRIAKALLAGADYQKQLLDLIDAVDRKSKDLIREAERSSTAGNREAMTRILKGLGRIVSLESTQGIRTEFVSSQVESVQKDVVEIKRQVANFEARLMNRVNMMFIDGARQQAVAGKEAEKDEQWARRLEYEKGRSYERLQLENRELSHRLAIQERRTHHDALAVKNWNPHVTAQQFPWQTYNMVPAGKNPWTLVPRFVPQQAQPHWYQGHNLNAPLHVLQAGDVHNQDIISILESADSLNEKHRSMVSQIVGSRKFDIWATSHDSQRLLIEDNHSDDREAADALSWFSALIIKGLHSKADFAAVVFFCGMHADSDDEHTGVESVMRSLTGQLLQQLASKFGIDQTQISFDCQNELDLSELLRIFEILAKRIPPHATLVCILDGVNNYENAEYEDDLMRVLHCLIGLTKSDGVSSAVKVLATSATKTVMTHKAFQMANILQDDYDDDDSVLLSTTELPQVGGGVDESDLDVDWTGRAEE